MNATCQQCHEPIHEEASKCKHCGYDPSSINAVGWFVILAGIGLCLTGIGAIIGIPLLYGAYKGEKNMQDFKPATHEPT